MNIVVDFRPDFFEGYDPETDPIPEICATHRTDGTWLVGVINVPMEMDRDQATEVAKCIDAAARYLEHIHQATVDADRDPPSIPPNPEPIPGKRSGPPRRPPRPNIQPPVAPPGPSDGSALPGTGQ